ncbi:LysR family transcriptional regulator, hydrogen peroxide-inducible genes activator [Verrucomicrobium sp. GAS474]|uniref:LysR substrate-binding domain-containing protein n=1 Tax=Verrucomicrobium sp. GAS474 TaxID=1882831 RepID=UPI00087D8983|nr:LysR substrate-binding domain-containing protein [Verrucomicrobium sp. GAS474]SDU06891.1 LysR family transcriptional regulator, hydrogen peroxide-inducible genes activator [Verrucomicrobium sp. GAS474]
MNLRDLHYIVAVAEVGNMARAAERCHVSQSTLSIQVKKLEETLGVPVFERTTKRLRVTRPGEEVVRIAREIMARERELRAVGERHRDPLAGEFRLGAFPTLAPYWYPRIVPRLRGAFAKLRFVLVEDKTPALDAALREGRLDAAVMAEPEQEGLERRELFREPFLLAVPPGHRLGERKRVSAGDLAGENLLLLEEGHCLRGQVLEFCSRLGADEAESYRATSLETLRSMVGLGAGITLVPRSAVAAKADGLRYLPFAGEVPSRTLSLFTRKGDAREKLFAALAKALKG